MSVQINTSHPMHYAKYVALIDEQLGVGYVTEAEFEAMAVDNQAIVLEALEVNCQPNRVLGVLIAWVLEADSALHQLKIPLDCTPDYIRHSHLIGIFKSIAIDRVSQKKGVGSALVNEMMRAFERLGADSVVCVAWQYHDPKHGEVENIKGIMDAFGFERFASIADYWADELDSFICPKCITPPCRCQATIYFKPLKDA